MIYLDNAATTYPKPECVYKALDEANRQLAFNAGRGSYFESERAQDIIEDTRKLVGSFVSCSAENVIFSSSATEALNQIIYGLDLKSNDCVYVSPFEHNAVLRPLHLLHERLGIKVSIIPFSYTLALKEDEFLNMMAIDKPKAIFCSLTSNVNGYMIPYERIFELAKKYNTQTILDASQGFGILPINKQNVDYIVFDGHKTLYASFGVGGFIITGKDNLIAVKAGGTGSDSLNENMAKKGALKYEAGSHNVVAIAGLNVSCQWLKTVDVNSKIEELTKYLLSKLAELSNIYLFHEDDDTIFGIVSFSVDGYNSEDVGTILRDEFGIAVRTGYHCAAYFHELLSSYDTYGTVRVSLGYFNTKDDIDRLIEAIESL